MNLFDRWDNQLEELRAQGRYRQLRLPQGVDFSSNDYLGYANLTARSASDGVPGTLSRSGTASRLLRGHHELWEQVETRLAAWHEAEAALMFPSGYAANEGLLSTVIEPQDWVASDQLNHASIIDGIRLSKAEKFIYRHRDFNHLEDGLRATASARPRGRQLFIVTESLFGMEGTMSRLDELIGLCERYGAFLIVDEAHATGCLGSQGRGLVDQWRAPVIATVHTGGKALGVPGAYVCGSARLKELLINRCRHFIFTTALPPQVAAWWLETIGRTRSDEQARARLRENTRIFQAELAARCQRDLPPHYIVPILLGDDQAAVVAAETLQCMGFDIRAIRPPTVPQGTARLRVSLHADHAKVTLVAAAAAIAEVLR